MVLTGNKRHTHVMVVASNQYRRIFKLLPRSDSPLDSVSPVLGCALKTRLDFVTLIIALLHYTRNSLSPIFLKDCNEIQEVKMQEKLWETLITMASSVQPRMLGSPTSTMNFQSNGTSTLCNSALGNDASYLLQGLRQDEVIHYFRGKLQRSKLRFKSICSLQANWNCLVFDIMWLKDSLSEAPSHSDQFQFLKVSACFSVSHHLFLCLNLLWAPWLKLAIILHCSVSQIGTALKCFERLTGSL